MICRHCKVELIRLTIWVTPTDVPLRVEFAKYYLQLQWGVHTSYIVVVHRLTTSSYTTVCLFWSQTTNWFTDSSSQLACSTIAATGLVSSTKFGTVRTLEKTILAVGTSRLTPLECLYTVILRENRSDNMHKNIIQHQGGVGQKKKKTRKKQHKQTWLQYEYSSGITRVTLLQLTITSSQLSSHVINTVLEVLFPWTKIRSHSYN